MTTRTMAAAIIIGTVSTFSSPTEARRHHMVRSTPIASVEVAKLKREIALFRNEVKLFREALHPASAFASVSVPFTQSAVPTPIVMASLGPVDVKVDQPNAVTTTLRGVSTAGMPGALKDVLMKIQIACNSQVISGLRPGARVRGSGNISLHASWRAADISMRNYACAYPILAKSPCGYSTDPGRVRHIHISCSPGTREYGRHFVHWQPGHRRYARRHGRHHAGA